MCLTYSCYYPVGWPCVISCCGIDVSWILCLYVCSVLFHNLFLFSAVLHCLSIFVHLSHAMILAVCSFLIISGACWSNVDVITFLFPSYRVYRLSISFSWASVRQNVHLQILNFCWCGLYFPSLVSLLCGSMLLYNDLTDNFLLVFLILQLNFLLIWSNLVCFLISVFVWYMFQVVQVHDFK